MVSLKSSNIHPTTNTRGMELLKNEMIRLYSHRISQKHRLIYKKNNENNVFLNIAASIHYENR